MLLILLSVPVFMVIWGASGNDLAEVWNSIQQGVTFGGVNLSPTRVLTFILIFGIFVSTVLTLVVIPVLYYAAMRGRIASLKNPEEETA